MQFLYIGFKSTFSSLHIDDFLHKLHFVNYLYFRSVSCTNRTVYMNKILGGFTMKNKKTKLENGMITSEWEFDIVGCIYAIANLIQVLHQAGII